MSNQNPIEILKNGDPDAAIAFDGVIKALINNKCLDVKTKQLVYLGVRSALGDKLAIQYYVPMAKKLGATREEIKDTILLTLSTSELRSVLHCLPEALNIYDATK